jgi:hypothetical protein
MRAASTTIPIAVDTTGVITAIQRHPVARQASGDMHMAQFVLVRPPALQPNLK